MAMPGDNVTLNVELGKPVATGKGTDLLSAKGAGRLAPV